MPRDLQFTSGKRTGEDSAMRVFSFILFSALLGLMLLSVGCGVRPASPYAGVRIDPASLINPFAPVSMKIHPLTRVDRDSSGRLWIICHIEMRDAWGEPVKGIGTIQIDLYRPVSGRAPHAALTSVQELTWDMDLTDMEANARLYDAPTRTYRLALRDAPEWLAEAPEPGQPRGILRAMLTTPGPQAEELILEHELALQ